MEILNTIINDKYHIIRKIADGGMSYVYYAEDTEKAVPFAVKVLKTDSTSNRIEDIIRFKNEAGIVSKIKHPNIVKVYEIGEINNTPFLIMEYLKGNSLSALLEKKSPLPIQESLLIIKEICTGLVSIHDTNIIHRDLKPSNIIVTDRYDQKKDNEACKCVKIIDFGLFLIKEFDYQDQKNNQILGTFSYMSPEQFGVIRRQIDERSDIYSLGIMFYEMLTGRLPFEANNIHSLIHKQIAMTPPIPTQFNPLIPPILEKIVLKLINKEPEKRYQSIQGVLNDLEKFISGQEKFELGLNDKIIKLNFKTSLIGREKELNKILSCFYRVQKNEGNMVFISGEAGRGKTRLVEEFHSKIFNMDAIYIEGKCFSGKNKIPYGVFKDALNFYIRNFQKYSKSKKEKIRTQLKKKLDGLEEIALKLNPGLVEILGECPELVKLDPEIENQRFLMVAGKFFCYIAEIDKPLAIFLDDLQWADDGSYDLLHELMSYISTYPLFILGTYRDNELSDAPRLDLFVNNYNNQHKSFTEIKLNVFDKTKMNQFISRLLSSDMDKTRDISNFIFNKSKGNPFFIIEILKELINEKALTQVNGTWIINRDKITTIEISSNIVDILMKNIKLLDTKEYDMLSTAAVIGKKFNINLLFSLLEYSKEDIVRVVDHAIELQLLETDYTEKGIILFAHDRIKEAFYNNIDKEQRTILQNNIGKTFEKLLEKTGYDREKYIFDLAYYYIEAENLEKILEYAFPAALQSIENYANEEAIKYLSIVLKVREDNNEQGNKKWLECKELLGQINLWNGKVADAIKHYEDVLEYVQDKYEIAKINKQISQAYLNRWDWKNSEKHAAIALRLLNEKLPKSNGAVIIRIVKELFVRVILSPFPLLFQLDKKYEERTKLVVWLYYLICTDYTMIGSKQTINSVLRMMNYAEVRLKDAKELALSYQVYALFLAEIPLFRISLRYHKFSLKLRRRIRDEWGVATSLLNMGFYYKCRGEYFKSINCFKENINYLRKIGYFNGLGPGLSGLAGAYANISDYENALLINNQYFELTVKVNSKFGRIVTWMLNIYIYTETGDYKKARIFGLQAYQLAEAENDDYSLCMICTALGRTLTEEGDFESAITYLEKAKVLFDANKTFLKEYTTPLFPFLTEAYIKDFLSKQDKLSIFEQKKYLLKINKLRKRALVKTAKWITYHVCSLRVNGLYYKMIAGNYGKANGYFQKTIKLCRKLGRKYDLALAHFELGKLQRKTGRVDKSVRNLEQAYSIFKDIKSKEHEMTVGAYLGIKEDGDSSRDRFIKSIQYYQRLKSLINLSKNISSLLNLDELLDQAMHQAIQVTKAKRGYLMLYNDDTHELEIKVSKNIQNDNSLIEGYSKSITYKVFSTGIEVLTTNAGEDERFQVMESVIQYDLKSIMCVPLKHQDKIIGVCYVDNPLSSAVFNDEDLEVLNILMGQVAISIENARLYKLAVTDGLTDVYNHRHFEILLKKELERSKRFAHEFSIVMIDIDHFKSFNDTYGHQIGDEVLKRVTQIMKEHCYKTDIIARFGGEEFIIILPETIVENAKIAAEKIRNKIADEPLFNYRNEDLHVTISLGISCFPLHATELNRLVETADIALYQSKKNGRNCSTVYNKSMESKPGPKQDSPIIEE